jgi:hypothetical protein
LTRAARRALLAGAAAGGLLAGCAAPVPSAGGGRQAPVPRLRIGDRWRYLVTERPRDLLIDQPTLTVAAIQPDLVVRIAGRAGAPLGTEERFASPWAVLQETIYGETVRYDSAVPLVPLPLGAGDGATTVTTWRSPDDGRPRRWTQRLSVGGWETVEVPAGRYECLRVDRVIGFEHADRNRGASTRTDRLWYAPQVARWVRREWRGEYTSAGLTQGSPAEGIRGDEGWIVWELSAWLPAPVSG